MKSNQNSILSESDELPIQLSIERLTRATRVNIKKNRLVITYDYTSNSDSVSKLSGWEAYEKKKSFFIPSLIKEYWNKTDGFLDFSGLFDGVQLEAIHNKLSGS